MSVYLLFYPPFISFVHSSVCLSPFQGPQGDFSDIGDHRETSIENGIHSFRKGEEERRERVSMTIHGPPILSHNEMTMGGCVRSSAGWLIPVIFFQPITYSAHKALFLGRDEATL